MKKSLYILGAVIFIGLTACNSEEANEAPAVDEEKVCTYSYNEGMTELTWTAFKTSDSVPVAGTFNQITMSSDPATDIKDVIASMSFEIATASVETNNEDRNGKIAQHFFGKINTEKITGKVIEVGDNGKMSVEFTMNGMTLPIEGTYSIEDKVFSYHGTMNLEAWNALAGVDALNAICKDLHTGADGVSKLWSHVDLAFKTTFKSDCD